MKLLLLSLSVATLATALPQNRQQKLFSLFNIVKFKNDVCTASNGNLGTCYTEAECSKYGGTNGGSCASTFGVCCTATVDNCAADSQTITVNNTYITSAGYPGTVAAGTASCATSRASRTTYTYTIKMTGVVQLRFEFLDFEIDAPSAGVCSNSTLTFSGADAVTMAVLPSNLCGTLTGQHIVVSTRETTEMKMMISLGALGTQRWNILLRAYGEGDTNLLAPRGCLQYHRDTSGSLDSFNYITSGNSELLTDHAYTICIRQDDKYCDVALTSSTFQLSGTSGSCKDADDKLVVGTSTYCGATFGSVLWKYMGNYVIGVSTAATNAALNDGFSISYMLLPC